MALMTYAQAACAAVRDAMKADPNVVVVGEDVGRGGVFQQYRGLLQEFGAARVIDTPISEATIVGAGVGMALAGLKPVVEMRVVDFALCGAALAKPGSVVRAHPRPGGGHAGDAPG